MQRFRDMANLPRLALTALVVALISQATIIFSLGASAQGVLRMQTAVSFEDYREALRSWGPVELDAYWAHLAPDILHPFFYAAVIMLGLAWALEKSQMSQRWNILMWMPWVAGLLDEIENVAHICGILALPDPPYWTFAVGNPAAIVKWLIAFSMVLMIPTILFLGKTKSVSEE